MPVIVAERACACPKVSAPGGPARAATAMKPEIEVLGISIKTFGVTASRSASSPAALVIARRLRELDRPVGLGLRDRLRGAHRRAWWARALYFLIEHFDTSKNDLLGSVFSGSGLVWYGGAIGGRDRA